MIEITQIDVRKILPITNDQDCVVAMMDVVFNGLFILKGLKLRRARDSEGNYYFTLRWPQYHRMGPDCRFCGWRENPVNAVFCGNCGKAVREKKPELTNQEKFGEHFHAIDKEGRALIFQALLVRYRAEIAKFGN